MHQCGRALRWCIRYGSKTRQQRLAVQNQHLHAGVRGLEVAGEAALHYLGHQQRVRLVAHLRVWVLTLSKALMPATIV